MCVLSGAALNVIALFRGNEDFKKKFRKNRGDAIDEYLCQIGLGMHPEEEQFLRTVRRRYTSGLDIENDLLKHLQNVKEAQEKIQ